MKNKLNILLTGATGTVGSEVVKQLYNRDDINLYIFDIENSRSKKILRPYKNQINIIYGDISKYDDIKLIPTNIDVVIHLAAIIPPLADELHDLTYNVNVLGTKNLVEYIKLTSPNAFFIYSSSVSVYGDRVTTPLINVDDAINPSVGDYYAVTKIEAENIIKNSNLRWTIFRLTAIMKNHKISKLMFHMPLDTILEICSPPDTATAFIKAISSQESLISKTYNLGGGDNCCISYHDYLANAFQIFGLGKLDFPKHSFAEKNYHCGKMADGDMLESILHFRSDNIHSHFEDMSRNFPSFVKLLAVIFRKPIKYFLLKKSEPYMAMKMRDKKLIDIFFNPN